jgi:predicted P-loop ATPase
MTEQGKVVLFAGQRKSGSGGGGRGHGGGRSGGGSGGAQDSGDWTNGITRSLTGKPESTTHNALLVMEHDPALAGLFVLDEFSNVVRHTRKPCWLGAEEDEFTDQDGTELSGWLGSPNHYRLNIKPEMVMGCVEAMARRRKIHPVRDYLSQLQWDGVPRITSMFPRFCNSEDTPYTRQSAQCFLVSAVARILWTDPKVRHNGAQVDFMLVLEGEQGLRKTSAVRSLFGPQWYAEAQESPSNKDFYQALRGRWCVEIGEMDSFSKADVTKVKQAITSRFDTYRPSYGRVSRSFRRECVFVGTTNESEYLRDPSGGRRFLPVKVGRVDTTDIELERDQLWAEAVALYRDGFAWWELPPDAAEQQDARFTEDSWQGPLQQWLHGRSNDGQYPPRLALTAGNGKPLEWTTTTELLNWALNIDVGKHGKPEQMRVAAIMRRLKWTHTRVSVGGYRERRWIPQGGSDVPF